MADATIAPSETPWPLDKANITLLCFLVPIVGACLYHAWKSKHPAAARHANLWSWVGFGLWSVGYITNKLL